MLALRAMQVQVLDRSDWQAEAVTAMVRPEMLATTRGELLDCKGRVIAEDESCFDACVDFDALADIPDPVWLRQVSLARITSRGDDKGLSKSARAALLVAEQQQVVTDLDATWKLLARDGGMTLEQIDDLRHSIVSRVELRGKSVTNLRYAAAMKQQQDRPPAKWYERIFNDSEGDQLNRGDYQVDLAEAHEPHPILRAIDNDTRNQLGLLSDRFPWLKVLPSVQRFYPYRDTAAQVIGRESSVTRDSVAADPYKDDPLRKYGPSDLVGTSGLESLCEPLLRGSRGKIERVFGQTTRELSNTQPQAGQNVQTTLDIELQQEIQLAFKNIAVTHIEQHQKLWEDHLDMPGAAVVIDVASGEVRALASYPSYDLNRFDEDYEKLNADVINRPLLDRATQLALEPGSTVKPMVGMGAITQGTNRIEEPILCSGFFMLNGKPIKNAYRCWTARLDPPVYYHRISKDPDCTGELTFPDALQRSCNVYFETTAYRMGMDRLTYWLDHFGMGRTTGIGITESTGSLPHVEDFTDPERLFHYTLVGGIGQGCVLATPIQIANEAATIARNGIWVRPHLVPFSTSLPRGKNGVSDRLDLQIDPAAVAAAQEGMYRVVNTAAGTGNLDEPRPHFSVAGKTGSAQTSLLVIPATEAQAATDKDVFKVESGGKTRYYKRLYPGTHEHPNPLASWYRYVGPEENQRSHAWFMGFAPADHPKVAIAVLVEYGGSGGAIAGQVFDRVLDALVSHGYLPA